MPTIVQKSTHPVEVQSQDAQRTLPLKTLVKGPEGVQALDPLWIHGCVSRAIDRTLPRKEAAFLMGLDPSLMNRQLQGDGKFDLRCMANLPLPTWFALIDECRLALGVPDPEAEVKNAIADISRGLALLAARASR